MNVSCGYINEHGDNEMISIPHFENAINFGYELLKMGIDKVWEHKAEIPVYENTRYSGYGSYGTYGTGYSWGAKADKSFDLFDDLEDEKVKVKSYVAYTPAGAIELPLDCKDQDDYFNEMYANLHSLELRDKYLTHTIGYPSYVDNEPSVQSDIDEALVDSLCPNCWGPVEVDNSLLLYVTCDCCESTWNIPNEGCE
jgi:hypothetical protein